MDISNFDPRLITALRKADRIAVLTGAGVSAESGIPTFRDAQTGLWAQYRAEDLATPEAFRRNPRLVWDWYAMRRESVLRAAPNAAHMALVELECQVTARGGEFSLITQNVDGLHTAAGSQRVIELHGNIRRVKCFDCGRLAQRWEPTDDPPPRCANCGGLLRPDVVWFGERLPADALNAAWAAAEGCDVFLSIGTSGLVEPAASLPRAALRRGATVLTINLDVETRSAPPRFDIRGKAGELLTALLRNAC
jgi:NAD-dependent deacetylase